MSAYRICEIVFYALSILGVVEILIAYAADHCPRLIYWCQDADPQWQKLRRLVLWIIALAYVFRGMSLLGMIFMAELLQKLAERSPQLVPLIKVLQTIISWLCWCIASEIGNANDTTAGKEWLSQQVCSLSSLEFYELAHYLKQKATIILGPLT